MSRLILVVNLFFIICTTGTNAEARSPPKVACVVRKPVCPRNEELSNCVQAVCRAQNCTEKGPIACAAVVPEVCDKGCICKLGFLRDSSGKCIPEAKCPVTCGINEEFSNCTQALCRRFHCSEQDQPVVCQPVEQGYCYSGCVCKAGYLWTEDGDCVPENQCYGNLVCSDKEIVNTCPPTCFNDYCLESEDDDGGCPAIQNKMCGEPVCTCPFNYKRADNGTCIPIRDCPPFDCSCRPNEEYNPCPPMCPSDSCSEATLSGKCPLPGGIGIVLPCQPSCRCKKGYWRNNGICVPYEECPGKCPVNEKFSTCIQRECRAQNCTQKDHPVACSIVENESCKQGCICEEGYLRDDKGNCVKEDKCPVTCGTNEVFSNCTQSICRRFHCSEKGDLVDCPVVPEGTCKTGCVCKAGYLWTEEGDCVPEEQCYGDIVCSDKEIINTCPPSCLNDYCPQFENDDGGCPANKQSNKKCGEPVCTCHFNNKRADNGTCIPTKDCPPFDCSARPNEEYNPCPPICPSDSCSQARSSGKCPLGRIGIILECKPSCRCKKGYWRNDGICVPYEKCPGKCPVNEKFSTCIQRECRAQNCTEKNLNIACSIVEKESCKQGCVCEEGYLRDAKGKCIKEDKCPVTCGVDEVFSNCTQSICRRLHCSQLGNPVNCPEVPEGSCRSGCVCKAGYAWTEDGDCVPENQCYGDLVCSDKEIVNTCPPTCFNDYCLDSEDDDGGCPAIQNKMCGEPVCTCPFNYKRADNGTCIPIRDCPPFDCSARKNEKYDPCPPICPSDSCSQASPSGKCPIPGTIGIVLKCEPKCRCIEGYWRTNNTCVPYERCPGNCPSNEEFSNCTQRVCRAQNCSQKGEHTLCPAVKDKYCKTGCVCVEGTLRDADGKCVPESKCPVKKCGENEVLNTCTNGCELTDCPKSFVDEQKKRKDCVAPAVCGPSKCRCKKGYRRLNGKCIPIEQCPGICSANEEFSNCTQAICRELKCSQNGKPITCGKIEEDSCESGCVCQAGYLRTAAGKCVPDYQCYGNLVCEQNEEAKSCSNNDLTQYCPANKFEAVLSETIEAEPCSGHPACTCRFNYKRAENGTCIPARDCPPFDCDPNEEFNPCPPHCPGEDCRHATPTGKCLLKGRIGTVLECKPNCRCVSGYWRNNGVCVPYDKCPGKCPSNEEFSNCTQRVCRAQNCSQKGGHTLCPAVKDKYCKTGCVCVEGTLRNEDGKCVPEDKCPAKKCDKNEFLNTCTNGCDAIDCPKSFRDEQKKLKDCVAASVCGPTECRCKTGYRRLNGKCIPIEQCPGICSANEEFSNCTQAICRELKCSQKGKPLACPAIEKGSCKSGCVCQDGYLRTAKGKCVPDSQCHVDLVCQENEVANTCSNNILSEYCPTDRFEAILSAKTATEPCSGEPECTCRFNYKRAENGTCIPARECPPFDCDQPNEEFNPCPPLCPGEDCSQATLTGECPLKGRIGIAVECKPNCRCVPGYWRNNGACVPYADCPGKCSSNEEFSNCTQRVCRAQNCSQKGEYTLCPAVKDKYCKTGCVCVEGTLRNEDGKCVPEDKCPAKKCDKNEFLNTCTNGCDAIDCPKSFRDEQKKLKDCVAASVCGPTECRCKTGYRRLNGKCIPIEQCPGICSANEEFSNCTQAICRELKCSQKGKPLACPAIEKGSCKSGCVCQDGYLRTAKGKCVPDSQCHVDLVCQENEVANTCSNNILSEYCPTDRFEAILSAKTATEPCSGEPECTCRFNYKRAENGTCIPTQECPPFDCDQPNEEFNPCPPLCPGEDCSQATLTGECPLKGRIGIAVECQPNCRCISGYWRNNGACVPYAECPGKCSSNEEFSNCTQRVCRAQNCSQKGEYTLCPAVKDKYCKTGCVCVEGTLRNEDGKCVAEDKCPAKTCGENEFLNTCTNRCNPIYCPKSFRYEKIKLKHCVSPQVCGPAECRCLKGYRRKNGKCIPIEECPGICSAHEEFSNCTQALCRAQHCKQRGLPIACPAIEEGSCRSGCVCKTGMLRGRHAKCIPEDKCPAKTCGKNEFLNTCTNGCDPIDCPKSFEDEKKNLEECVAPYVCGPPECRCNKGYRRQNGKCIPIGECPGICSVNEEFSNCIQALCRAQNCTDKGQPIACPEINEDYCESGCVCKEGTLRDKHGKCVPEGKCPAKTCGKNEYLNTCTNSCDLIDCPNSFTDEKKQLEECVAPTFCGPDECRCIEGYRRHNGKCIPIRECPGICSVNEEFSNCIQALCRAQNCTDKGQPIACPRIQEDYCESGCVCKEGTLRDKHGKCVPEGKCPAKTCGKNEFLKTCTNGCDLINCPKSFEDEKKKRDECVAPAFCGPDECRCIEGYRRHNGNCIPIRECPGICSVNEEFSNCIQALCRAQNCTDKGQPIACPRIKEDYCASGCVCKEGMLRDKYGKCIPEDKCPAKTCGKNEFLNNCTNGCDPIDCPESFEDEQRDLEECVAPYVCGPPECRCKNGYRRQNDKCIPIEECPGICSANEEFSNCTQALCRNQNCKDKGRSIACPAITGGSCKSGCVCKEGTLRDKHGKCIPEDKCPAKKCGKNEFLKTCTNGCDLINCPKSFEDEKKKREECVAPAFCGPDECRCIEGYRRYNGKCIPIEECPGICSANEEFSNCTQALCRTQNCKDKGRPIACPAITEGSCKSGCVCKEGTLRDKHGKCVPEVKCPAKTCGKNEYLKTCTNGCDPINCPYSFKDEKKKLEECVAPAFCGPDECRCIEGYRRHNGKCIPIQECPGICSVNEEFSNCIQGLCRAQSCTDKGQPIACPRMQEEYCESGCVCKEGTLRDKDGICVPEGQCPAKTCGKNEFLKTCTNGCDLINCPKSFEDEKKKREECVAPAFCGPDECRCIEGYRRYNGKCIPIGECPGICPVNAEFSNCIQALCRAQNCTDKGRLIDCPEIYEDYCESGCVCKEGMLRDKYGKCIPEDKCPAKTCGKNEFLNNCTHGCDPIDCPRSFEDEQRDLEECVAPYVCGPPKCTCKKGYRRQNGKCIPIEECPGICSANEEFSNCTQSLCRAQNCKDKGRPIACPAITEGSCKSGCVCKAGMLRDKNGQCIPENKCPAFGRCGANEEFSKCTQAVCRTQFCRHRGKRITCPRVPKHACKSGCICKAGTLRDRSGKCVPEEKCPAIGVCAANEEFSNCVQAVCRTQLCSHRGHRVSCRVIPKGSCRPGCVCEEGTLRDRSGRCVPEDMCPVPRCGVNEFVNDCTNGCDPVNCPKSLAHEQAWLQDCVAPAVCGPRECTCLEDYRRLHGKCIPIGRCPGICPVNEEYSNCTQALCRAQDCSQAGRPIACAAVAEGSCNAGCVCKPGMLRDASGACVPEQQCNPPQPPQCNQNEVLSCVNECPPETTCRTRGVAYRCKEPTKPCEKKCVCKPGYYRNPLGTCISEKQCDQCSGDNEFFACDSACDNECSNIATQNRTNCPIQNIVCNNKCYCENGFARDHKKQCVPVEKCPASDICNGPNEEYVNCKMTCPPELCVAMVSRYDCSNEPPCKPGCACKNGFFRIDKDSPCIPVCSCPQMIGTLDCLESSEECD